jgi:hypothetical protein
MNGRFRPIARRFAQLIVMLAIFAVAEPLLHSHPLTGGPAAAASACAVCASVARIAPAAPSVAAPRIVIWTVTTASLPITDQRAPLSLPSRAPPAV